MSYIEKKTIGAIPQGDVEGIRKKQSKKKGRMQVNN